MGLVLGVDAGNSKTHALVGDEQGMIRSFASAGPGNHQTVGLTEAIREIRHAVEMALEAEKPPSQLVELGCFCLAGADLPEDYKLLSDAVSHLGLARRVVVKNDTLAALRAGASRPWGIVVICGAGFNAAGRSPDGREIVLPGLGFISGDRAGGGALAQEMIRQVMRAWDGRGRPTLLTKLVLEAFKTSSEEELISLLYHRRVNYTQILDLVPKLFVVAEAGDPVARELVTELGVEVGTTANALIRRLHLSQEDVEVVLGGGVFKAKSPLLLETITRIVRDEAPRATIVIPRYEPVVGAFLLGLDSLGVTVNDVVYRNLEATQPAELMS